MSGLDLLAEIVCDTILCPAVVGATQQRDLNVIGRLGTKTKTFIVLPELQGSKNG